MDFANESADYFGVMGSSLKKELLDNLNVALETMKELQKMSDNYTAPNIDYSKTVLPKDSKSIQLRLSNMCTPALAKYSAEDSAYTTGSSNTKSAPP